MICRVDRCRREAGSLTRCDFHLRPLLSRAFAVHPESRQGAGAADFPPAHGSGPLLGVALASTAGTRTS